MTCQRGAGHRTEMSVYSTEFKILASDVDMYRRLRLSRLFTILQDVSLRHTDELGMGRDKTLDRGILWVVTMQRVDAERLPVYDEVVRLETWIGRVRHVMFPRFFRMTDLEGHTLLTASGFWMLIDEEKRCLLYPQHIGIAFPEENVADEPPLPSAPKSLEISGESLYTVPFSSIDLNGHMNNARYLDLAENVMPEEIRAKDIRRINAEYAAEIRPDETVRLETGAEENAFYMACTRDDKRLFRIRLDYDDSNAKSLTP